MKKLLFLLSTVIILSSCSTTKNATSSSTLSRDKKRVVARETVKNAVESKRFIVKLNRMYPTYGGIIQLVPRENYIIVDGEKGIISTPYFGRQFGFRPISGINMFGRTMDYKLIKYPDKGAFGISMKVSEGGTSFNVFLQISRSGTCDVSISSMLINNVRYSGNLVPINNMSRTMARKSGMI
jgi:hypothetical protein